MSDTFKPGDRVRPTADALRELDWLGWTPETIAEVMPPGRHQRYSKVRIRFGGRDVTVHRDWLVLDGKERLDG